MKQQVQKRKDEVRNMTMIMMSDFNNNQQNQEGNTENILEGLEGENNQAIQAQNSRRSITSTNQSILNISKANRAQMNMSISHNQQNTTLNFMKMQRQLIKQVNEQDELNSSFTNDSEMDCPQLSILFPDKVQKIKKSKQDLKVPYLNMRKVREMMAKREQKMRKQWQQQKHHINPTNKIIQLQNQLDITRKQLANQSLKFRLMSDQIKHLRLKTQQLQRRNQLLVESNYKLKTNHQIIFSDYQICKSITTQIERVLGQPVNKQNEKQIKTKISKIIEEQTNQMKEQELQLTFRQQSTTSTLNQIFNFKDVFRTRSDRAYSI